MKKFVFYYSPFTTSKSAEQVLREADAFTTSKSAEQVLREADDAATKNLVATMDRLKEMGIVYTITTLKPVPVDYDAGRRPASHIFVLFDTTDEGWIVYQMMGNRYEEKVSQDFESAKGIRRVMQIYRNCHE